MSYAGGVKSILEAAKSLCLYWTSILYFTKAEPCSDVIVSEIHSSYSVLNFIVLEGILLGIF